MENWFDKNKFFEKLLIFTWIIFLFFCLYLLSFTSYAASVSSGAYPYNIATIYSFDNYSNINSITSVISKDDIINSINEHLEFYSISYDSYIATISDVSSIIYTENNRDFIMVYFLIFLNPSIDHTVTNDNFITNSLILNYPYVINGVGYFFFNENELSFRQMNVVNNNYSSSILGTPHPIMTSSFGGYSFVYTPGYPFISQNLGNGLYSTDNKLIIVDQENYVYTGQASNPHFDGLHPHYGNTVTKPEEVPPSYTINNYSWTTYNSPSIDNSSVESLLESLIYVINYLSGWLSSNISGEFSNLLDNLEGFFTYIGETLQYYGDLIIDNIQNGIQNFYDNMVSLVEPIFEKLEYISEPVDGTIIYDNISTTSLVTNISSINSSLTSFKSSFDSLSEPNSFTIPIHLENLPSAYFGNQTTQYIDLGVLGSTEKAIIRTFMWAIITYSLFITIVDSISNYINGGGDES